MALIETLTAQCDTEGCQASVSLDISNVAAAIKVVQANGWLVSGGRRDKIPTPRAAYKLTCPWCVPKPPVKT